MKLINATCVTEGHLTAVACVMEAKDPVREIDQQELLKRVPIVGVPPGMKPIDSVGMLAAFERYNGPNFFSGRFMLDADDLVYACDRPAKPKQHIPPVVAAAMLIAGLHRRS